MSIGLLDPSLVCLRRINVSLSYTANELGILNVLVVPLPVIGNITAFGFAAVGPPVGSSIRTGAYFPEIVSTVPDNSGLVKVTVLPVVGNILIGVTKVRLNFIVAPTGICDIII